MNARSKVRTVAELAELCGAEVEGDVGLELVGPASLDEAGPEEISFLAQPKYAGQLASTRAGAVLVAHGIQVDRSDLSVLRCEDPERSFNEVVLAFAPPIPEIPEGRAASAEVHLTAAVDPSARIGPQATVGQHAVVGPGVVLHPGARVGAHVRLGAGTVIHENVVLYPHTVIGERCVLHAGTVIGSDGFGFLPADGKWIKTPQMGNVVIEDDVETGSNVSIDCARFGSTRIGAGSKIDNLVHVAHNVRVGPGTLLLAQVGIAGSSTIGAGVIIAGQAGITGHATVGDGARILGGSGVTKDVPAGEEWFGYPAGPRREKQRRIAGAERAGDKIKQLERELGELRAIVRSLRTGMAEGGDLGRANSQ